VTIVWIILGVIVLIVVIAMVTRFRSDEQLEEGGSFGRQLSGPKKDEPPEDA
jgi:uncharacterized membrane protein